MDLEQKLKELKYDYIRLQGDLEKIESTGHSPEKMIAKLHDIEDEMRNLKKEIRARQSLED
ncbi:SE1832 family protein [Phocicoccus pinnipedialis]|uniref:DNA repair/chromosome segregation ATPase n=1 Tax=Phocicoccus pinnipedialis TaxID=110845 RepID=A0A6V7R6E0_9BACL|nr:SE1832 family protein [Jeotgalicoccus pinnipedialis]MBP1939808.1 putative nucleic acid-binding Zn-ribbon protein [Jeotgalicoccus pinnipedialis]CAD2072452.1 hypothetical protein JEOPIN946_00529 [Jeotgalicoccus pinnipedialis]